MNETMLLSAIGGIDEAFIAELDAFTPPKKRRLLPALSAAAACMLLFFGIWLASPGRPNTEQVRRFTVIPIDGWLADYTLIEADEMSNFTRITLAARRGELYFERGGTKYWLLSGSDSPDRLILEEADGERTLLQFARIMLVEDVDLTSTYWYEWGWITDADLPSLKIGQNPTLSDVFSSIYAITAEDIASVRFDKASADRSAVGERVAVPPVAVRDDETIAHLFAILASLPLGDEDAWPESVFADDEAYLSGSAPLSAQTDRKMRIRIHDGRELVFTLHAADGCLSASGSVWGPMTDADAAFLAETAGIDLAWRDWGRNPPNEGETAAPSSDTAEALDPEA